ncbi:GNAT family N-acetyltransferase [Pseudomonas sp. J452]|uniref:GNAT family N-acetyltransferase n=1 Tax=Pseudomonas sp. J452 TaxID=2898441 RepID=UPI00391843BD
MWAIFSLFRRRKTELQLCEASDVDLSTVRALLMTEARNGHFTGLDTPTAVDSYMQQLRLSVDSYRARQQVGVILQMLVVGRESVGFVILRACPEPAEMELHMLIIAPEYRRRGYASQVVQWFVNDLRGNNRRLMVRCLPASEAMIALLGTMDFTRKPSTGVFVRHFLSPLLS